MPDYRYSIFMSAGTLRSVLGSVLRLAICMRWLRVGCSIWNALSSVRLLCDSDSVMP